MRKSLTLSTIFVILLGAQTLASNFWTVKPETQEMLSGKRQIVPDKYMVYTLDVQGLKNQLLNAPLEFTMAAKQSTVVITLPMPDGSWNSFSMVESPIMQPELAAKYPFIKTYSGSGINNQPSWVRIDFTQWGFHALIRTAENDIYIDPYSMQTTSDYLVYFRKDFTQSQSSMVCEFDDLQQGQGTNKALTNSLPAMNRSIGTNLRTYRLALACTGEYAAYYGGTKAGALSGMVTSVNRVTGVYESEVDVRLNLIANTDTLIFLDANTDPYSNNNGGSMLGQNQSVVNFFIGTPNYDIGHVFSTGGGGIAYLGCICKTADKAKGVTGSSAPINDPFNIDYVAHEMGHQFGGNHTFNSVTGSCQGNREASAAFEPGSGVTIMGYAGICGSDDLAAHSIAYFHTKSFDEIVDYSTLSTGNSCPVNTITFNNAPTVSGGGIFNVPVGTAFKLDGYGSDPDGDSITFSWEQFDLGPAGAWSLPTGNAPMYRSYAPSTSALRLFPKLSVLLNQVNAKGELITSYARSLHFRLTARDNKPNGGGVTYNDTITTVNIVQTAAPFAITYPNVTGISWPALSTQTVTWDVGGTDAAPFNEQFVNIYLSINNGTSFPITIATNVANNGSYTFTVPNNQSNICRMWVEGASTGSIFFDINNKTFTITAPVGINEVNSLSQLTTYPNPADNELLVYIGNSNHGELSLRLFSVNGQLVLSQTIAAKDAAAQVALNVAQLPAGLYFLKAETENGTAERKIIIK